ncbi:MAG: uracil phosphoribosyltransferase [Saprospiraceae bacterium]
MRFIKIIVYLIDNQLFTDLFSIYFHFFLYFAILINFRIQKSFFMITNLSLSNSVVSRFVAELRDVNIQKDRLRFRRNMERIGEIFAYEISKTFDYEIEDVETPLGIADAAVQQDTVVLATILRAGLPMHTGMLNYLDDSKNAFVSAYRKHHKDGTFEIEIQYVSCPDIEGSTLIICDPMLATGASMDLTIQTLLEYGTPEKIHIVTAISSVDGLEFIKRKHPDADVWLGGLDEELTAKSYIVPGLGDAGDLSFGEKVQD